MNYTQDYTQVNPLRQGWVDLLSRYRFTWFTTLTFRDPPKSYSAINHFNAFIRGIQHKEKVHIGYYVGLEFSKLGTVHLHALMGGLQGVRRDKWWLWWYTRYGACRIEPYDCKLGASHYVTKYVTKRLAWYNIQGVDKLK